MKAIAFEEFGGPEVLQYRDLPDPLVGPEIALVKVEAAGVNPVDFKIRQGYLQGLMPHHLPAIPGWDVAGTVTAVFPNVTDFVPGDEVFGYVRKDVVEHGSYAELVAAPQRCIVRKPANVDWVTAGALPLVGLTALQALRAVGAGDGDTVLVHAAAGGVGHVAVQLAQALGAKRVLGTASERNHDYLRELGVEPVTYGDGLVERVAGLVGGDGRVDAVVDLVGGQALSDSPALVRDRARHCSIVGNEVLEQGGKLVWAQADRADLTFCGELAAAGRLRVDVERTFPLAEAAAAHRLLEEGHVRGKLVLIP
ncbi:NADPH:quinone reductase-like Zn-dependent oxidoreductase [Crossiella equi]|uniref:NADPH:quinone reductase-like Zn-dependent oxidoreductase n=1 Tax=Crossiella equi TaxID=130796 RepID=A0ABS5ABZ4_9PSEU|nr:NADP-dependent oxidoreductase [Crossiella equi]MBP2473856.1 NADPH:quinone reductase-like Zn-dependent oxidoreductase [Crossiella equi]